MSARAIVDRDGNTAEVTFSGHAINLTVASVHSRRSLLALSPAHARDLADALNAAADYAAEFLFIGHTP